MGLQVVPGFINQAGYQHPAELMRNFNAAMAGRRSGAIRYQDFALTPSGSAMQMTINLGDAVLIGAEASTQGGYYVWSNAVETIAWPASAGNPRWDTLVLRVVDTQYGTDASTPQAFWEVVSGTPAASPARITDSQLNEGGAFHRHGAYLRIMDLLVPAGVTNLSTATLDHKRKYARIGRHTMCLTADVPADAQIGDSITYLDGPLQGLKAHYTGVVWNSETVTNWINYTPVVRGNQLSGTPATISSTIDHARYKRMGDVIFYEFAVTVNAATSNGASISLPIASKMRSHHAGNLYVFASGITNQVGVAYHANDPTTPANWDRLCSVNINTGIQDWPSGSVVRASGFYTMQD
jgi:hypothetical protein